MKLNQKGLQLAPLNKSINCQFFLEYFLMNAWIRAWMPSFVKSGGESRSHIAMIISTFSLLYWTADVRLFRAWISCGEHKFSRKPSSLCWFSGRCCIISFFSSSDMSLTNFIRLSCVIIELKSGAKWSNSTRTQSDQLTLRALLLRLHRCHELAHHVVVIRIMLLAGLLNLLRRLWLRDWLGCRCRLSGRCCGWCWWLRFDVVYCVVNLLGPLFILIAVFFLHPEEFALHATRDFKQIDSVLCLLHLFKLCLAWKDVNCLWIDWVLGLCITELENFHTRCVLDYTDQSAPAVWRNHSSVVVHSSGLKLNKCLGAIVACAAHHLEQCLHLPWVHIHF